MINNKNSPDVISGQAGNDYSSTGSLSLKLKTQKRKECLESRTNQQKYSNDDNCGNQPSQFF